MDALDRHAVPLVNGEMPASAAPAGSLRTDAEGGLPQWLRIVFAGSSFIAFGLGGLLISLTVLPLARLSTLSRTTGRRRCQRIVAWTFRLFLGYMRWWGLLRIDLPPPSHPLRRPAVFVANHPTLIDVTIILAHVPDLCCIVKPGVAYNPCFWLLIRLCGHIPVLRSSIGAGIETYDRAQERIADGHSLLVFPEGTRSPGRTPLPFQRGGFELAVRTGVPVQPILIDVRPALLQKGDPWYKIPRRRAVVRVEVLEEQALHLTHGASARTICDETRRLYVDRLGDP